MIIASVEAARISCCRTHVNRSRTIRMTMGAREASMATGTAAQVISALMKAVTNKNSDQMARWKLAWAISRPRGGGGRYNSMPPSRCCQSRDDVPLAV
jgi:hypothetical protein